MYPPHTQSEEDRRRTNETQFAILLGAIWIVVGGIWLFASYGIFRGVLAFEMGVYCWVQAAQAHAGAKKKKRTLTGLSFGALYIASGLLMLLLHP